MRDIGRPDLVALLALVLCAPSASAQSGSSPFVRRIEIVDGLHVFSDTVAGAVNSVAIIGDGGVIVFDAGSRPSRERVVLEEIRRLTNKPVRMVINSHWHPDHWSGNEIYADAFPDAQFVATAQSREIMGHVAPSWPPIYAGILERRKTALANAISTGKNADGSPLTADQRRARETNAASYATFANEMINVRRVLPTLTFNDSLTLHTAGREIRLISLDGDAVGSAILYLPRDGVVLAGDLLVHPVTWTTNSFRIKPWIASLKVIRALEPRVIVPGHGSVFRDTKYLDTVIDLFEEAGAQVHAALARGLVTPEEVLKAVNLDHLRPRFTQGKPQLDAEFTATVDGLVRKVYQEARDGMESRR